MRQAPAESITPPVLGGNPLPDAALGSMSAAFGPHDLSSVRVHEGASASAIGAEAFTRGEDIHFRPGNYDPAGGGNQLLGHELAHVVQQAEGRAAGAQLFAGQY